MMPKKPSTGGTIAKVVAAVLFLLVAPETEGSTVLVSLIIGFAFLAWAALPYRRYKQETADLAAGRASAAKRPGVGATVAKAAAGALFLVMAFDMEDRSGLIASLVLGAACLLWAVLPYRNYQKAVLREEDLSAAAVETFHPADTGGRKLGRPGSGRAQPAAAQDAGAAKPGERKARYCPYCGAPMRGEHCEYCGV